MVCAEMAEEESILSEMVNGRDEKMCERECLVVDRGDVIS